MRRGGLGPVSVNKFMPDFRSATSSAFALSTAGYASDEWGQMVGNSIVLPRGEWQLNGVMRMAQGTATGIDFMLARWATVNGDNTTSTPTAPSIDAGLDVTTLTDTDDLQDFDHPVNAIRLNLGVEDEIFLVGNVRFGTAGNGSFSTLLYAERVGQ